MQLLCLLKDTTITDRISESIQKCDIWYIDSMDKLIRILNRENDLSTSEILIVTDLDNKQNMENIIRGINICYIGISDDYTVLHPDYCHESLKIVVNNIKSHNNNQILINDLFSTVSDCLDLDYYIKISPDILDVLDCNKKHISINAPKHMMQEELSKYIAIKNFTSPHIIDGADDDFKVSKLLFGEVTSSGAIDGLCHKNNVTIIINNANKLSMMNMRKIYQLAISGKFTRLNGRYASSSNVRFIFLTNINNCDSDNMILLKSISSVFNIKPISEWDGKLKVLLFMHFVERYYNKNSSLAFSKEVNKYISNYQYKDNIVEMMEMASFVVRHIGVSNTIELKHLPSDVVADVTDNVASQYNEWLKAIVDYNIYNFYDVNRIIMAGAFKLGDCYHNRASKIYGVADATWRKRVRKYGLDVDGIKKGKNVIADIIDKYKAKDLKE